MAQLVEFEGGNFDGFLRLCQIRTMSEQARGRDVGSWLAHAHESLFSRFGRLRLLLTRQGLFHPPCLLQSRNFLLDSVLDDVSFLLRRSWQPSCILSFEELLHKVLRSIA